MKNLKKSVIMVLVLGVLMSCFTGAFSVQAATKKKSSNPLRLVATVTKYSVDYKTKKWHKDTITSYTYKKGYQYPASINEYDCNLDESTKTTFKYEFRDNKKPKKMRKYDGDGNWQETVYYKQNGARWKTYAKNDLSVSKQFFQYSNSKSYFSLVIHNNTFFNEENPNKIDATMEEADSISVTTKNGLLKKTTNTGMYANCNVGDLKDWQRFNGTYTANYNSDGILTSTSATYRMGPSGKQDKFCITRKNGRITQIIRKRWVSGSGSKKGHWENDGKITFTYKPIKTTKRTYSLMINESIIGSDNNYYIYSWY